MNKVSTNFLPLLNMQGKLWHSSLVRKVLGNRFLFIWETLSLQDNINKTVLRALVVKSIFITESRSPRVNIISLQLHAAHPDVTHTETTLELHSTWRQRSQTRLALNYFIVGSLVAVAPQQGLAGRGPLTFPHTPPAFLCRVPNAELPSSPTGSDLFHLLYLLLLLLLLLLPLSSGENGALAACRCH